jgi:hypothetical protein
MQRPIAPDAFEELAAAVPPSIRPTLLAAREFLRESAPGLREGMKWNVPFFMLERNLFYLDPKEDRVVLGFCQGADLPGFSGVFDRVLKEVAQVDLRSPADLQRRGLREAVRAAAGLHDHDGAGRVVRQSMLA